MDSSAVGSPMWMQQLGSAALLRAHLSTLAVGAVLLLSANLLTGGGGIWATTAIGIWALLLFVHVILVIIVRLLLVLQAEDDAEEIVLLPIKEAVIVPAATEPTEVPAQQETAEAETPPTADTNAPEPSQPDPTKETVSWQVATDAARLRKTDTGKDTPEATS